MDKKRKLHWDGRLPEDIETKFRQWYEEMQNAEENVKIPRLCTIGEADRNRWQLHTFTDASGLAFGAVVFLRMQYAGEISVQLMLAKSKLAPIKGSTISRLELLGCVIGSQLAATVRRGLHLENFREVYWTDSSTALAWIRKQDQANTYVSRRVCKINSLTDKLN
jgi:hypothetical protein